ncbi:sensor domain-containing protein [Azospirillum halopraeferens]|uniref:sensor domain-containing protein n=1 Tax=Azospirillum halopraeferens TaxID=34010 RepID=UPI00041FCB24|nr:EAL domain-containing protein [Azospirillum halopraeferens]
MSGSIDRYLLAERAGSEGVWDWDLRTDTLYLSPRFKEFLGLSAGDAVNRPEDWLNRVHPDDVEWLYASFEGQMVGVTLPFQIEHRVRRTDRADVWRWLVCRGVAVADESGEPVRLVGSVADVTDRKLAEERLRQSEERYALAAAASNDGLYDWDLTTGTVYYSPRWKSILGYEEHEIGNRPEDWFDRVVPDDLPALRKAIDAQRGAGGEPFQVEHRMLDAAGNVRWMSCRGLSLVDDRGVTVRIVGSQTDVTARKLAEQQLRHSEERYALAAQGANDGLWDWQLDTDEVYYSPRWKAMLGCDEDAVGSSPLEWLRRVHPADRPGLESAIALHLTGRRDSLQHEFRMTHADGSELWMVVRGLAVRDGNGRALRMAGSMTDITARKQAEQQLLFDALHDGMTGLSNRTLLLDRIGQSLDRHRRTGARHFAVLLLDIDRFKTINDTLGPHAGDRILRTIAKRLEDSRRMGDTLGRLSADEFSMLLNDIDDVGDALSAAERLSQAVARPIDLDGHAVVLTCSVGIALSESGYERPEDMLRDASLAMYRAKSGGRNRIDVFDGALRRQAMAMMRTESDLRTALEQGQLCLYYQPIITLGSGRIAGFEALMRWRHPDRGLVPPLDFIPLAEETGLIVPMGRWAVREAVRRIADWQTRFPRSEPLFMSVNVSSRQFLDDDLPGLVREVLTDHPIPPRSLKLEITESLLMKDPDRCRAIMQEIRAMDVRLSIDDFGTGYSSLAYLHRYPADTLKIDKTFVQAIATGESSAAIVQVITTLAAILGMDAVAEGIESAGEAEFLRDIACKYGQGYHFARPVPDDAAETLLAQEGAADSAAVEAVPG